MTTVVKVGGSLLDWPELGPRLRAWLTTLTSERILLVPGGGPTTDAIRLYDRVHLLGEETCHWLALATLTVNARVLSSILDVPMIDDIDKARTGVYLLDMEAFARADDARPGHVLHCWSATSDALALRVALVVQARELVLLKSVEVPVGMNWAEANRCGFVDDVFVQMLHNSKDDLTIRAVDFRNIPGPGVRYSEPLGFSHRQYPRGSAYLTPGLEGKSMEFKRSAELFDRACQTLATGVSSGIRKNATPTPMYYARADGPYFFDVDGHKLLDYTLAWGPLIVGSNHPVINARVAEQLTRGYTFGAQHEGEIALAETLTRLVPGVEQVIFSNSGSEAVQAALRLARAYTGRTKIIKFEGHYHGWLNNVLVSYRPKASDPIATLPTCGGQPASEYADTIVLPWNDLPALDRAFAEHKIAGVLTEPLLANSGSCMPQPEYLEGLVDLCRKHGAVSIFDEVITGFRLSLGGARSYFDVLPDLSVYGKAIAGGFTLSAVGGRADIFGVLRDGKTLHAGTYNGHPINIAAALATLEILSQPGIFDTMHEHGHAIREAIEDAAAKLNMPLVTTGAGTVFSVHFGLKSPPLNYRDTLATDMALYTRFRTAMLARGVLLLPDGRWYVGATHGDAELQLVLRAIEQSFAELK